MVDKSAFIADLGLGHLSPDEQDAVFDDFTLRLGEAISDGLGDAQMDEFGRIIDGDQAAIDGWLALHAPDFRSVPEYQQLEVGYREDPEKVPADKVFATLGWIRVNRPDFADIVTRVTGEFRAILTPPAGRA